MFSLNRFWQYTKADIQENKTFYWSVVIGSFVAMILMAAMFRRISWQADSIQLKYTFNSFSSFITLLTVCLAFWDLPNKGKLLNLIQMPVSTFEKFLERIILFIFVFIPMQRLFFLIVEYGRTLFLPRFDGDWFMSIYGRLEGETLWQFFMNIDQVLVPAMSLAFLVFALAIYFSATIGGLKAFLNFCAAFGCGLVAFVCFVLSIKHEVFDMVGSVPMNFDSSSKDTYVGLIFGSGSIVSGCALCVKTMFTRNIRIRFKGLIGTLGTLGALAICFVLVYFMLSMLINGRISEAIIYVTSINTIIALALLYAGYYNYANRQLVI